MGVTKSLSQELQQVESVATMFRESLMAVTVLLSALARASPAPQFGNGEMDLTELMNKFLSEYDGGKGNSKRIYHMTLSQNTNNNNDILNQSLTCMVRLLSITDNPNTNNTTNTSNSKSTLISQRDNSCSHSSNSNSNISRSLITGDRDTRRSSQGPAPTARSSQPRLAQLRRGRGQDPL